jgi:hypothetical protein
MGEAEQPAEPASNVSYVRESLRETLSAITAVATKGVPIIDASAVG